MYDVIVVGARCAGAAAALRFARSGRSVLVLEKSQRGSDTLSTHVLHPGSVEQIDRLGVLETVLATGAPPVRTVLWEFDGQSYPVSRGEGEHDFFLCVRRTVLDPLLVAAAEQTGAEFRFGSRVNDLIWDGGRVVGVRGLIAGEPFTEWARLVVGADGRRSIVARKAQAREYNVVTSKSAAFYAYLHGVGPTAVGADVFQFASGPGCDILCCPCDGRLHILLLIVKPEEFKRISSAGLEAYQARLQTVPTLTYRLADATCTSKLFRASQRDLRGYFREPYGPGWALVGDAGYYSHPAAANGIRDALRSAELCYEYTERAWAEGLAAEMHLDQYQSTRDAENMEPFHFSYRLGYVNPFQDLDMVAQLTGQR